MAIESMRHAWNAYTRNFWTFIAASLIWLVLALVFIVPTGLVFGVYMVKTGIPMDTMAVATMFYNPIVLMSFFVIVLLMAIVMIQTYCGYIGLARNSFGRKADINTIMRIMKKKFWPVLGLNALLALILLGLFLLCMLPFFALMIMNSIIAAAIAFLAGMLVTVLVGLLFVLANQAMIVENLSIPESLHRSVSIIKRFYLDFFILSLMFFVAYFLIGFLPVAGFLINWFVVIPLFIISCTTFYIGKSTIIEMEVKMKEREKLKRRFARRRKTRKR